MEISTAIHQLQPRGQFRIARTRVEPFANVLLRIFHEGVTGWGEASPNPFYHEDAASVQQQIHRAESWLRELRLESASDLENAWSAVWELVNPSRAAQCAIDLALWDWLARREKKTVAEVALGREPRSVVSFATIGLSTASEMNAKIEALRGFPRIKIKSDRTADVMPIVRVREQLAAEIAVDANCAWTDEALPGLVEQCADLGVRFIEQPFAPGADASLQRGTCALPIFADESCVVEEDVDRLAQHFDGINVKLVKCGGLTPALRMLRRARALGLSTMVGCMLETSVLIAAGCVAGQIADYADLDGAWLIENDPCTGWKFHRGVLTPPGTAGLGAAPHA